MNKFFSSVVAVALLSVGTAANAEFFGLQNGRSADLTKLSDLSVEGGFNTGDDYDYFGVRINYRVTPGIIAYGDVGQTEFGAGDGTTFGIGLYYQLQDLISSADTSIKASYHTGDLEYTSSIGLLGQTFRAEESVSALSIELLASGREPLSANGLEWYAQLGIHRVDLGFGSSDTELGFGGGVILPLGAGEAYFGIEHIDELIFGLGFRYNL